MYRWWRTGKFILKTARVRVQSRRDAPCISGGVLIVPQFKVSGPEGSEVFASGKQSMSRKCSVIPN